MKLYPRYIYNPYYDNPDINDSPSNADVVIPAGSRAIVKTGLAVRRGFSGFTIGQYSILPIWPF